MKADNNKGREGAEKVENQAALLTHALDILSGGKKYVIRGEERVEQYPVS